MASLPNVNIQDPEKYNLDKRQQNPQPHTTVRANIFPDVNHRPRFSHQARRAVLAKGIFDVLFSLTVLFLPSLSYTEILPKMISKITGLQFVPWQQHPTLGALIMGCAFSAFTAGQTESDDAFRVVAALNGAFAITGLLICTFMRSYANSFLLIASLQDILWFLVIQRAGGYGVLDCLGLSQRGMYILEEKLSREVRQQKARLAEKIEHNRHRQGDEHHHHHDADEHHAHHHADEHHIREEVNKAGL